MMIKNQQKPIQYFDYKVNICPQSVQHIASLRFGGWGRFAKVLEAKKRGVIPPPSLSKRSDCVR